MQENDKESDEMKENQIRAKVAETARSWLGTAEADGGHWKIIDIYNNHRPLAQGYKVKYTDSWCAVFASVVAIQAGTTDVIPTECSCGRMIDLLRQRGSWVESDTYTPRPGDLIFYDWDDTGRGDCTGYPDHVGIVTGVAADTITVVEGNRKNAVRYRRIARGARYIRGYGVPKYGSMDAVGVALDKLSALGVINSPWIWADKAERVEYLDTLIVQAAQAITHKGVFLPSAKAGAEALHRAGVINTPEYWINKAAGDRQIADLLGALGGSV